MKSLFSERLSLVAGAVALVVSGGFAAPVQAQIPPPIKAEQGQGGERRPPMMPRSITVSGEAHGDFAPDRAIVNVTLMRRDKDLANAKKATDELVKKLLEVAEAHRVPREKVVTSNVYVNPEYSYETNKQPQLKGYVVNRTIRVTLNDLSVQEQMLAGFVKAGIDQVNGVEFDIENPEKYAAGLRVKAFENARAKAQALAEVSGSRLGPVLQMTVGDASPHMPQPVFAKAMRMEMAAAADSVAPSVPGNVTLQESVNVTFVLMEPR